MTEPETGPAEGFIISGPACFIKDSSGVLIDNIDTDMIFHNAHLAVTELEKMGQYALGNLAGWSHFPDVASKYRILVVGNNFGAGSSRQQAVDCFRALGIKAILAQSFGSIYLRNAINSGVAVLPYDTAPSGARNALESLEDGSKLSIDLSSGEVQIADLVESIVCRPLPPALLSIVEAGGLFEFAKARGW